MLIAHAFLTLIVLCRFRLWTHMECMQKRPHTVLFMRLLLCALLFFFFHAEIYTFSQKPFFFCCSLNFHTPKNVHSVNNTQSDRVTTLNIGGFCILFFFHSFFFFLTVRMCLFAFPIRLLHYCTICHFSQIRKIFRIFKRQIIAFQLETISTNTKSAVCVCVCIETTITERCAVKMKQETTTKKNGTKINR